MLVAAVFVALTASSVQAADGSAAPRIDCGTVADSSGVGPYDYRDRSQARLLSTVEQHHFFDATEVLAMRGTSDLEYSAAKGKSASVGCDLDYTLRAFPNHHRALLAMSKYQGHRGWKAGSIYMPIECYFERAMAFVPGDNAVRLIASIDRYNAGQVERAIALLEPVATEDLHDPELHYNLGLFYMKAKRYNEAVHHAQLAEALGYPLRGLRRKLEAAGHWPTPPS